jgi:iron complex outermembrane receptor protein
MNRMNRHCLALTLLLAPGFLAAQTAPTTTSVVPATKAANVVPVAPSTTGDEPKQLEAFEVTGSRIRTLGEEATAIPVFTIPQIELERSGVSRLADIRRAMPQLGGSVGFNDNLTNGGTSRAQQVGTSFNLRGLGGNSTLVLVDGQRIPRTGQEAPGGAGGREDFSVDGIPVSAIERIDILPEGAGAVYGSEAIAGVVNIVLKKSYNGGEVRFSYDNPFKSDVAQFTGSVTAGYRMKKLSTFLTLSWEKQNALASRDRWFTATSDSRVFGATAAAFYLSQPASGAGAFSSTGSPQNTGQANLPGLTTNIVGLPANSNGTTAANTAYTTSVPVQFDPNQYSLSIDPARRKSVLFRADYQLTPAMQLFGNVRWSRFENEFVGTPITLSISLPVGYPGNPFTSAAFLRKVFYDLPPTQTDSRMENMGATVGVRGDFLAEGLAGGRFFKNWRYTASAAWSRNVVSDDAITGGFNFTLLNAAIASTNKPLLAYDSSRGRDPNAPGVLAALMPVADHKDTTDVYQYLVTADGNVWSNWAGDVRAAVGAEAGEEKVKFWREPSIVTPTFVLTKPFSRKLTAGFVEVTVPLLSAKQHLPLMHLLEVGGAARATDYDDIGGVTTPTYRGMYKPAKWLTLRTSRSEGFKPVRLYDLQAPVSTFTQTLTTTSNIRDPRRGNELVLGTFTYKSGGNPALKPEESVSKNGGIVIDVPGKWFKGLSLSADYYQIDYTDRSGSTGIQNLLNFFPERVTRAAPTAADTAAGYAGVVTTYDASNINLAWVKTKGWDYRVTYQRRFDAGDLRVTTAMTDPNVAWTKSTPAAVPTAAFGHQPKRFSGSAFWARGAWDAGASVTYQNRYYINGLTSAAYPSFLQVNPQVSYNFGRDSRFNRNAQDWTGRWFADTKFSLTIINALNREPEMIEAANGRIVMDPRLRRFIFSAARKF